MTELIAFLSTTAGIVTSLTILIGAFFTVWAFAKKKVSKEITEVFEKEFRKIDKHMAIFLTEMEQVKATNLEQTEKINQILENQEQLCLTDKHILRTMIAEKYYRYSPLGYFPLYERECVSLLYEDYKKLHGNTFIDDLFEKTMLLPCDPNEIS